MQRDSENRPQMDTKDFAERLARLSPAKRTLLEMRLQQKAAADFSAQTITRCVTRDSAPLSFAQQRLWFLNQLEPMSPVYNESRAIRLRGHLDVSALQRALDRIVARHEVLRTNFVTVDGNPQQRIADSRNVELRIIDLQSSQALDRESEIRRLLTDEIRRPFDLSSDLLLRVLLLRLAEEVHILLFVKHHIASDGWSTSIFWRELSALYEAFASGRPDPLPELPIQYADYALWQRNRLSGEILESQLRYWRKQLDGLAALQLVPDHSAMGSHDYAGDRQLFLISQEVADKLKKLSRSEGVTLFMTLLGAFQTLLYRYTGQSDIAVGSPIAGRTHPEVENLIGFFVNTLVLRTQLSGYLTFRQLLARVREVAWGAYQHQELPFEKLVAELQPDRNLGRNPLFQVVFAFQNVPRQNVALPGLAVSHVEADSGTTKFDLALFMWEEDEGLRGRIQYSTDLFDAGTIERLLGHFETMLYGIVTDPDQRLSDLPLLTDREKHQILVEWNTAATRDSMDTCIHDAFEAQAKKSPDAVALVFEDKQLTYLELNRRANRVAHYLRRLDVRPETLVGICMERSIEMIVGLLGILKAGAAYVPLDPAYPKQRLGLMLEDSRVPVLLTQEILLGNLPPHSARLICLDKDWEKIARESDEDFYSGVTENNLAYVIYTSGSTGKPKGVAVTHHNVTRLFASTDAWFHFTQDDVWTLFHSYAFDFSVWEIWGALLHGGQLVIVSYWVSRSPELFYDLLCRRRVTVLNQTPAAFRQLIEAEQKSVQSQELALRLIIFGGEALDVRSLQPWFDRHGDQSPHLINMYGITETTVHVTYRPIGASDARERPGSPIGMRISDLELYILDTALNPTPIGVPGELYVGGAGLARGYINAPEITAERFIPHPFSDRPGARLYKTGDVARYLPNDIEFFGRADEQVKIRGYRIELGEIEAILAQHPDVRQTVVLARQDAPGDKRLVAYVVSKLDASLETQELRKFLKEKLPDYMIPPAFVFLDSVPLTGNGKIDRKALPAPDQSRLEVKGDYVAPTSPTHEMLAEIWAKILQREQVGIHENFFDLGGHSLLATHVVSRICGVFQLELTVRALFEAPTIAELAERIERVRHRGQTSQTAPLLPVSRDKDLPLSFAQQRLWFLDQLEFESTVYNVPSAVRIRGQLDVLALERSLNEIVRRHEALRTTFSVVDEKPVQLTSPTLNLPLRVIDLADWRESEREVEARRFASEEARKPFDLTLGPLLRVTLLRLWEDHHVLLLTMHHIVSDGWSMGVLYRELSVLYEAFSEGRLSSLADLTIQYADFAVWQREWLQGEVLQRQLSYWKNKLEGIPAVINLPTDRPRPVEQSYKGARESIQLSKELTQSLRTLSRKHDVTLFMTLLTAFQILLQRYSGQDDIVVGSPIANRNRTEIESLIGFFANTLVLRSDLTGNPTFRELLARVREVALGAYAHQDLPFEKLVEELNPERDRSHAPLFQVMFVLQNAPTAPREFAGLRFSPFGGGADTAKFDLTLSLREEADEIRGSMEYSSDLFNPATIHQMIHHFENLLKGIVADPNQPISHLSILGGRERHQLLVEWNDTATDYPKDACIHELFEEQVEKSPEAVAVVYENQQLTYKELNCRANQLAHYLHKLSVGPDSLVAISMERSIEMIVGLLGILKAGGAYVPLDPEYPKQRLAFMLEDTQASVLLTQQRLVKDLFKDSGTQLEDGDDRSAIFNPLLKVICLDRDREAIAGESMENLNSGATAETLAYVMYTSGSTGEPKGVAVPHRGVVRLLFGVDYARFDSSQTFLHLAPTSFDASTFEIWGALLHGAKCVLYPGRIPSPAELGDILHQNQVSLLWLTASLFNALIDAAPEVLSGVRQLLVGGEALSVAHVLRALARLPQTQIINGYGPTESTTFTCCHRISRQLDEPIASIPIGRPIANTQVYVLDANLVPVPVGVPGELYISGDGLARGYLYRPKLTAEKFIPNPFSDVAGSRLYRTGDRVRYLADGNIEFLGRTDNQVKIRGYRIELGEIEAVLERHPAVRENAVIVRENVPGDRRLVAYFSANQELIQEVGELRTFLKQKLPDYLIPSDFVSLDVMPLTSSGKVDRGSLAMLPDCSGNGYGEVFVAPRDKTEFRLTKIWERILNVQFVGVQDSFFDLGGHSLLAVRLLALVEKEFGRSVTLAALFEAPTVEKLADSLQRGGEALHWNWLVPLQPVGLKPPLFLAHISRELAHHIGTEQPIYGLKPHGMDGNRSPSSVEAMAADYVREIRMVQAKGPYAIGGYSFGGLVALEMARQLMGQGQEVAFLILLDPTSPSYGRVSFNGSSRSEPRAAAFGFWSHLTNLRGSEKARYLSRGIRWRLEEIKNRAKALVCSAFLGVGRCVPFTLRPFYRELQYHQAAQSYVAEIYPGSAIVLRTKRAEGNRVFDWSGLVTGELELHDMPGGHLNAIYGPHAKLWGERLRLTMQRKTKKRRV